MTKNRNKTKGKLTRQTTNMKNKRDKTQVQKNTKTKTQQKTYQN